MTILSQKTLSPRTRKDLRTLSLFINIYCRGKNHPTRHLLTLNHLDNNLLCDKPLHLCTACTKLLHHSIIKRTHCPQDPKPACKDCSTPCDSAAYRLQIREVMRFSGWRLLLTGRLDYLFHLLKRPQKSHAKLHAPSQFQESTPAHPCMVQIHCSSIPPTPTK